jgi:hypothetical protein
MTDWRWTCDILMNIIHIFTNSLCKMFLCAHNYIRTLGRWEALRFILTLLPVERGVGTRTYGRMNEMNNNSQPGTACKTRRNSICFPYWKRFFRSNRTYFCGDVSVFSFQDSARFQCLILVNYSSEQSWRHSLWIECCLYIQSLCDKDSIRNRCLRMYETKRKCLTASSYWLS